MSDFIKPDEVENLFNVRIDLRFKLPGNIQLIGPSNCGKTTLLVKMLKRPDWYFTSSDGKKIKNIIYCYNSAYQPIFDELRAHSTARIRFTKGLPTENVEELFNPNTTPAILVLDDLMQEVNKNADILQWITADGHHRNFGIIFTQQSLFPNYKNTVQVRNNCTTKFLWNFATDKQSVDKFLGKMERGKALKWLSEWYSQSTEKKHGYVVVSKHPKDANSMFMYRRCVLKKEGPTRIYINKNQFKKYKKEKPRMRYNLRQRKLKEK